MKQETFKKHYTSIMKKIIIINRKKEELDFNGKLFISPLKYNEEINIYNDQISKYRKLQEKLILTYGNQLINN